jgi:formimidoylglutamate deiminase
MSTTSTYWFPSAWLGNGFASNVRFTVAPRGEIVRVETDVADAANERCSGIALPGMINVHSHAFQRGMAGLAEHRTAERDSFWTWRELMYHFLRHLTPDHCWRIARQAYIEMLRAGYTSVGEFHYLHNDVQGRPYDDRAAMIDPLIAAASAAGIRLCLLPTLYQRGGFDRPLDAGQQRFAVGMDECLDLAADIRKRGDSNDLLHGGFAIHSLRAVEMSVAQRAAESVRQTLGSRPIHIHLAEQQREVDDCLRVHGKRPVAWALDALAIDDSWCLIHATHLDSQECAAIADRQAVVGLCPTTEANLGDGLFPSEPFTRAGGQFGIGTDSHVSLCPRSELRLLEYGQRLSAQRRVILNGDGESCGTFLCQAAWRGGSRALGLPLGRLAEGHRADWIVLDERHASIAGLPSDRWLDCFVFCDLGNPIRDVMVGGRWVIRDGRHALEDESSRAFGAAVREILSLV